MEERAKSLLILLMLAFLFGVLIHLIIPIEIVINATQRIEQVYNGYKIEVEQNTVRSIAYLNSVAISNQIQMYENLRSYVIRLFDTGTRYEITDFSRVNMVNAYLLTKEPPQTTSRDSDLGTMWFIPGVTSYGQMTDRQKWIMQEFSQIQEHMSAIDVNSEFHEGFQAIEITINFEGEQVYFQYPAAVDSRFSDLQATVLSEDYNMTVLNYKTFNRYQTLIITPSNFKACSSILDNNQPFAVVCLKLNILGVVKKLSQVFQAPNFQLSTSRFYLIKPLYNYQQRLYPQILANFSSQNLKNISLPLNESFTQLQSNLDQLFSSPDNYGLYVQQLDRTKTYYVTPIETYNNLDSKEIVMYFMVINDFAEADLKSSSHEKEFFVVMIVPSTVFLIISAVAMWFNIRPIFAKLRNYSFKIHEYCSYIQKNDLYLEINEQAETSDFVQIFKNLKCLNMLNKLSTMKYLKVPENQRIMKLLHAQQLFDQLGYSSDSEKLNIYENLGYCYQRTGDLQKALEYLELSIKISIREVGGLYQIEKLEHEEAFRLSSQKKSKKQQIRHLRFQLYKSCMLLFQMHAQGAVIVTFKLEKNVDTLGKLVSMGNLSLQYIYGYLVWTLCCFQDGLEEFEMEDRLERIDMFLSKLEELKSQVAKLVPLEVLKSYRYYLRGLYLTKKSEWQPAYQALVIALDGIRFDPLLHKKIKKQISSIMELCKLDTTELDYIFHYLEPIDNKNQKNQSVKLRKQLQLQQKQRLQSEQEQRLRQYIFLFDVSNPGMSTASFNSWKKDARKMAQFIFDEFVQDRDRVGISQFCNDTKVICNLIEKAVSESMLKKQLMSSIKARNETIYSHLIPNLRKVVDRTRSLKKHKVYIVFLKEGIEVEAEHILTEVENLSNYTLIFVAKDRSERINFTEEGFYVVGFQDFRFVDIILGEKKIKKADNIVHLF